MNEAEARQLLGVSDHASPSQVKSAYRSKLKRWHPDLFANRADLPAEALQRTQDINAAYQQLGGRASRAEVRPVPFETGPASDWHGGWIRATVGRTEIALVLLTIALVALSYVID